MYDIAVHDAVTDLQTPQAECSTTYVCGSALRTGFAESRWSQTTF